MNAIGLRKLYAAGITSTAHCRYPGTTRTQHAPKLSALDRDRTDEGTRQAYFDQSARSVGGKVAEFVRPGAP